MEPNDFGFSWSSDPTCRPWKNRWAPLGNLVKADCGCSARHPRVPRAAPTTASLFAVLLKWGRTTMAVLGVVDPACICGNPLMSHQMMVFSAIFCAEVSGGRWRESFIPL